MVSNLAVQVSRQDDIIPYQYGGYWYRFCYSPWILIPESVLLSGDNFVLVFLLTHLKMLGTFFCNIVK